MSPHDATLPSAPESETPNMIIKQTGILYETEFQTAETTFDTKFRQSDPRKIQLVPRNFIVFTVSHIFTVYGIYLAFAEAKWQTNLFAILVYWIGILGIGSGAHRLWAHRTYKAKWPVRLMLMIFFTIAFQGHIYHWCRDHRTHHKFTDTHADPHNSERGFFYSHMGWLLCRKQPETRLKGKSIDLSDLRADPIVMFQKRYYLPLVYLLCFTLPTIIPMYYWNETFLCAFSIAGMLRWSMCLHMTWCVNSVAHMFGMRPYDKHINPVENAGVSFFTFGEGYHNYHHVFPWDYKTSEWGKCSLNVSAAFIEFCAKIGMAYDLKSVSTETIQRRVRRTGDGTHTVWGWDDKDLNAEEKQNAKIVNKLIKEKREAHF